MSTRWTGSGRFLPATKTPYKCVHSNCRTLRRHSRPEMCEKTHKERIVERGWSAVKCICVMNRPCFPVEGIGKRWNGKRSAMSTTEVLYVTMEETVCDFFRISNTLPVACKFRRGGVCGYVNVGNKSFGSWFEEVF